VHLLFLNRVKYLSKLKFKSRANSFKKRSTDINKKIYEGIKNKNYFEEKITDNTRFKEQSNIFFLMNIERDSFNMVNIPNKQINMKSFSHNPFNLDYSHYGSVAPRVKF
jgi:hypothetical protein